MLFAQHGEVGFSIYHEGCVDSLANITCWSFVLASNHWSVWSEQRLARRPSAIASAIGDVLLSSMNVLTGHDVAPAGPTINLQSTHSGRATSFDSVGHGAALLPARTTPHSPLTHLRGAASNRFTLSVWTEDPLEVPDLPVTLLIKYPALQHSISPHYVSPAIAFENFCDAIVYGPVPFTTVQFTDGAPCATSLETEHSSSVIVGGDPAGYEHAIQLTGAAPGSVVFAPLSTNVNMTSELFVASPAVKLVSPHPVPSVHVRGSTVEPTRYGVLSSAAGTKLEVSGGNASDVFHFELVFSHPHT